MTTTALVVAATLPMGPAQTTGTTTTPPARATAALVMSELRPPDGFVSTFGSLLSDAGHVVGTAGAPRGEKYVPVRWEPDGTPTRLVGLGDDWMATKAVNDDGVISGAANTPDGKQHAVTWDSSGTAKRLQEPEGYLQSVAEDINNQHVAVGTTSLYSTTWAVRWDRDGKPTFLEKPPNSVGSLATRINDSGEIIGSARFLGTSSTSAVRWDASGKVSYLGASQFPSPANATDINNRGTVAGDTYDPVAGGYRAARALRCCVFRVMPGAADGSAAYDVNNRDVFLGATKIGDRIENVRWDDAGGMVVMKPVPGTSSRNVYALNDAGLAVGVSGGHAAVWDAGGNATGLPDEKPGRVLKDSMALTINNAGQVLGRADYWDVSPRAIVWR
ncbi:hypothetical protein ABZY31_26950 [Streptomyces sp. NPDC006529]|uniref:hypothetical protein n=1 Tax=Streptomyces sp. NPDC006529 TaxID=3157177 RepID=UPI0033B1B848